MPGQNDYGLAVLSLRPWRLLLETPSSAAYAGPTSSLTRTRQLAVNPPALFASGCAAEFAGSELIYWRVSQRSQGSDVMRPLLVFWDARPLLATDPSE